MSFIPIMENVEAFFDAFNILGMGLVAVWIVGSTFLANAISKKKDERILTTLVFLMFGGIIFFAGDPLEHVILITAILLVIYGMFKMLWKKKELKV